MLKPLAEQPPAQADTRNATPTARPWIGPLLIALAGAIVLAWSWGTWPDPLTDAGRELYVPWRLSQGDRLYADIAYFNGPLSPYVNALWFKLFGTSIRTLVFANLALLAILVTLIYRVMLHIAGRFAAGACGLVFILIFAFGQYSSDIDNYNYLLPYSHEATHGLLLAFAGLWFLSRFTQTHHLRHVAAMGFILGLSFLTKPEIFLASALSMSGGLVAAFWIKRIHPRRILLVFVLFLIAAIVPILAAWLALSCTMPERQAAAGVLGAWPFTLNGQIASLPFYRQGMGLLDPRDSLLLIAQSTAVYAGFILGVCFLSFASVRYPRLPRVLFTLAAILLVVGAGGWISSQFVDAGRPLPLAVAAIGAITLVQLLRRRSADPHTVVTFALIILSLALLLKIILYARTFHYGVFLAMPGALLVVAAHATWHPNWLSRRNCEPETARFAAVGFCAATIIIHLAMSARQVTNKKLLITAGPETIATDGRAHHFNAVLREIEKRIAPDQTLAVVPEGAMLNYLTRRKSSTPYIALMAPELLMFGEDRILASFQSRPPHYICLVQRDTSEYGPRAFGHGYANALYRWILAHYRPVHSIGASPLEKLDQVGMVLMERVAAPASFPR